ncbi:hypothetical protein F5Y05DRAFT_139726 [Hypoxylon sp. FL0543]|nr:hypothetical protein F5Y05DRAFT_139726 [Hypoxylon sp. FL0543]
MWALLLLPRLDLVIMRLDVCPCAPYPRYIPNVCGVNHRRRLVCPLLCNGKTSTMNLTVYQPNDELTTSPLCIRIGLHDPLIEVRY